MEGLAAAQAEPPRIASALAQRQVTTLQRRMASRQEEKERRKQERIEREQAEAAAAQRKRLIQVAAGVAVAAVIAIGVVVSTMAGGKDDTPGTGQSSKPKVAIPARKIADLEAAAKAAKCVLTNPPIEGSDHVTTKVKYKTNPPTSGDHVPPQDVASDGDYSGGVAPKAERYVHALEHGRIIIQYKPGLAKRRISQLETLFAEDSKTDFGLDSINGGFTLLMANNTKMTHEVAATAWGHMLACRTFNDQAFDAIRAFRQRYVLKGPEKITQPE